MRRNTHLGKGKKRELEKPGKTGMPRLPIGGRKGERGGKTKTHMLMEKRISTGDVSPGASCTKRIVMKLVRGVAGKNEQRKLAREEEWWKKSSVLKKQTHRKTHLSRPGQSSSV